MAEYTATPFLKQDPRKPATQGFEGENAGGQGTMGRLNEGEKHRQAPDPKGTLGPFVTNGQPSSYARQLIARSTGVTTSDGVNGSLYGKPGKY